MSPENYAVLKHVIKEIIITRNRKLRKLYSSGKTTVHEGSPRRTDLYLTTHRTHKRQTSMISAEFNFAIPASE
jgi:hypothetical protein